MQKWSSVFAFLAFLFHTYARWKGTGKPCQKVLWKLPKISPDRFEKKFVFWYLYIATFHMVYEFWTGTPQLRLWHFWPTVISVRLAFKQNLKHDKWICKFMFKENKCVSVVQGSLLFFVLNYWSHWIHIISVISHVFTLQIVQFFTQNLKKGKNCHSRISRFMQMTRSEITFKINSCKFSSQLITRLDEMIQS